MSTQFQKDKIPHSAAEELDLSGILRQLWFKRWLIVKVTGCFMFLGLLVYFFSPKEYTAMCEIVPQTSKNMSNNSMSRLASLAGINMGNLAQGEQLLSPLVYPNVLKNVALQRELLQTKINLKDASEPITLLEFLTDKKHQKFSLTRTLLRYTIGLPGVIMHAIKGEPEQKDEFSAGAADSRIIVLTPDERKAIKKLKEIASIKVDEKKGFITITTQMPEAYAAAQVAESTMELLQKYVTEFKIDKVQNNLEFIQGRYYELKQEYEDVQMARARFKDANLRTTSSRAKTELERLDNQYNLSYGIFSEIATQLEQAKIQVKETTPILTVINPVSVPIKPSKPRGMMLLMSFMFLGILGSCSYVLAVPYLRETLATLRHEKTDDEA